MIEKFSVFLQKYIYYVIGIYLFSLFVFDTCVQSTMQVVFNLTKISRYLCYLIFIVYSIMDTRKNKKITLKTIVFFLIAILITFFSKQKDYLLMILFLYTIKDLDYNKIIKICLFIYAPSFFITVILSLLGIIPDWTYTRGSLIRHSLGFYYATSTMSIYLEIILMFFYVRKKSFKYFELLLLETINVFLYKYTDGRLGYILITAVLIVMALSKLKIFKDLVLKVHFIEIAKKLSFVLPIALLLIMLFLDWGYHNNLEYATDMDIALNKRVKWSHNAFMIYPITAFGNNIEWVGNGGQGYIDLENNEYNYVDSSYIRIIFDYGVIGMISILYMYIKSLNKHINEKNYYLYIVLVFILIWSFIEPYIFSVGRNIFIITCSFILNEHIDILNKEKGKESNSILEI